MSFLRHWKILLTMLAIFAAGIVTGSMLTVRVIKRVVQKQAAPDHWAAVTMLEYKQRLNLTPEQSAKVQVILDRTVTDLRGVRASVGRELIQIVRQAQDDVARELTPEQLAKFDTLRQEQRQRYVERMLNQHPGPQFNAVQKKKDAEK